MNQCEQYIPDPELQSLALALSEIKPFGSERQSECLVRLTPGAPHHGDPEKRIGWEFSGTSKICARTIMGPLGPYSE